MCGLGPLKYNRASNYNTIREIWDAMVNALKGLAQVRKFKISYLFTEYKDFKMRENKSLHEMMSKLSTLANELTSLGKVISTEEQVEKVLRILPSPNGMSGSQ